MSIQFLEHPSQILRLFVSGLWFNRSRPDKDETDSFEDETYGY